MCDNKPVKIFHFWTEPQGLEQIDPDEQQNKKALGQRQLVEQKKIVVERAFEAPK